RTGARADRAGGRHRRRHHRQGRPARRRDRAASPMSQTLNHRPHASTSVAPPPVTASVPGLKPMPAARPATGTGPIGVVGPVLAVLLLALGGLLLHEALSAAGLVPGRGWLPPAADAVDDLTPRWWHVPAGLVAALAGAGLI